MITHNPAENRVSAAAQAVLDDAARELERADHDRFVMAMMAQPGDRAALIALFAANLELAGIPEKVSEAVLGQMRYQSWRDAFGRARRGENAGLPLAGLVTDFGFDRALLDRLIDAREGELLRTEPLPDLAALRDYASNSGGTLGALAAGYLSRSDTDCGGGPVQAARHAGTAYALVGVARAIPFVRAGDPGFIPLDQAADTGNPRTAIEAIAGLAGREIAAARETGRHAPPRLFPVLAAATIAESQIAALRRFGFDPRHPRTSYRGTGAALGLAWRRWRNRF